MGRPFVQLLTNFGVGQLACRPNWQEPIGMGTRVPALQIYYFASAIACLKSTSAWTGVGSTP